MIVIFAFVVKMWCGRQYGPTHTPQRPGCPHCIALHPWNSQPKTPKDTQNPSWTGSGASSTTWETEKWFHGWCTACWLFKHKSVIYKLNNLGRNTLSSPLKTLNHKTPPTLSMTSSNLASCKAERNREQFVYVGKVLDHCVGESHESKSRTHFTPNIKKVKLIFGPLRGFALWYYFCDKDIFLQNPHYHNISRWTAIQCFLLLFKCSPPNSTMIFKYFTSYNLFYLIPIYLFLNTLLFKS